MKTIPSRKPSKKLARIIAALVAGSFTLSGIAWAATSSISPFPNVPLGTNLSVAPNLIFLQDDSGSMQWDWIGDGGTYLQTLGNSYNYPYNSYFLGYAFPVGTPNVFNVDSSYSNTYGDNIPSFSGKDVLAGQYRSTQINPIYYNPAITYLPWACAVPASEENSNTSPVPTMTNGDDQTITCQWNSQVNLWLMPDATPTHVLLNPWFPNRGWRNFETWNDSTNPASTTTTNGGFSGTGEYQYNNYNGTTWWYVSSSGQIQSYSGQYINNFFERNKKKDYCANQYCYYYCVQGYKSCMSKVPSKQYGFWPAVYFNYAQRISSNTQHNNPENIIANYQKVEICPSPVPNIPLQSSLSGNGNTKVSSTIPACTYPTQPSSTSAYPYTYYDSSTQSYVYVTGPNQQISRTYTQEIQNYANWYQYARNHIFLARDGISQAFMSLPSGFRVDYATINQITSNGNNYSGVPFYDNGNSGGAAYSSSTGKTLANGSTQANAPSGSTVGTLQHFGAAQRSWFLSTFFGYQTPEVGTPSRQALTAIGNWLMQPASVSAAPWGASAGAISGSPRDKVLTCRQNFTVFVTDGGWNNDSSVSTPNNTAINNPDQVAGPTITGANGQSYQYKPTPPFMDQPGSAPTGSGGTACNGNGNCEGSLANIAFWYWEHPLQTFGSSNTNSSSSYDVPTSPSDPAFWPHMDTFTVGLGVSGYLNYPGDLAQLQAGSLAWSEPYPSNSGNNPALIDDLWHAGINGHGNYYSASNPTELSSGLTSALQTIEARTLSNSSVAVTGAQLSTSSLAFVPSYNTGNWTGDVKSFLYNPNTNTFNTNFNWRAQSNISAQQKSAEQDTGINSSSAPVYTFNGSTGIPFSSSSLSSTQQSELMNSAFIPSNATINQVVDNILGNTSEDGTLFRNRNGKVLGDIIDATPQYVGAPSQNYTFPGYGAFANTNATRIPMLYVPANDGMLHAIDACATSYPSGVTPPAGCSGSGSGGANAGKELWAYIPNAVIPYLDQRISASAFSHQYLMDSTPTIGAFCTAGTGTGNTGTCTAWESLLVASEGRGVSGIYGLNITNPQPSSASALAPWEITPGTTGFSAMGYIIASPQLIKTQSMGWVVVFGSGYQPTPTSSGDGYIYFVNPNNGALLATVTLANQVSGRQLSVAGIAPASFNAPGYAQALYVTDNEGDLWKIDLPANASPPEGTQSTSSQPTIGYGGGPMFVAETGTGSTAVRQPISTAPVVSMDAQGRIGVIFGTGQWLFSTDTTDNQTQSLYGIWDVNQNNTSKRTTPIPESDLVQQTLTTTTATASTGGTAYNTRTGSSYPVPYNSAPGGKKGWYINLPITGERLIDNPQNVFGDAIFTSFVPGATSTNPCQGSGSGSSWITAVNFNSGAVPSTNPFGFTGSNITVNSIQVAGQAPQPTVTSTATGMKLLLPGVNGGSPNAVPFFPPFNAGAATRAWTNR
ncbi:pilus assembly protein [Acidithiobacillus sp. M4-SHS-6]|uniref:pilus assembly protein n=1 Tax=Acidithiobacillus sp. M4-SHS-6 TaxID=3383024 RepID=UPI0039BE8638